MTQSEIEKAAREFATECLDACDSKSWVEMTGTDYFVTIRNTFLAGAEHARPKWIRCSERMPDGDEDVFVLLRDNVTKEEWFGFDYSPKNARRRTWSEHWASAEVTHWMPIPAWPAAPEAESK